MLQNKEIAFGKYVSHWVHKSPRRMLFALSYYKFALKLIGKNKKILDVGCNEGLGTFLLSKESRLVKGIDFDNEAISYAKENFSSKKLIFSVQDVFNFKSDNQWDAVVSFDVIEHIFPHNAINFLSKISSFLKHDGIMIIGTPSFISQKFASKVTKEGHVNIYSHERLIIEMRKFFKFVFVFPAHDEIVHTGFLPLAHYYIVVGCKKILKDSNSRNDCTT